MANVLPTSLFELRASHFRPVIGDTFYLEGPKGALVLRLVDVHEGKEPLFSGTTRVPFTLDFMGPPGVYNDAHLMLNLRHPKLGLIEGVGIGPNLGTLDTRWGVGQLWTVVFN